MCPSGWTTPGHNYGPHKYMDARSACTVPCPEGQPCVSCPKGRSNNGSRLSSQAQCLGSPSSVDLRVTGENNIKITVVPPNDGGSDISHYAIATNLHSKTKRDALTCTESSKFSNFYSCHKAFDAPTDWATLQEGSVRGYNCISDNL